MEISKAEMRHRVVGFFTAVWAVNGLIQGNPKYKQRDAVENWVNKVLDENQGTDIMKEAGDCYSQMVLQTLGIKNDEE